MPTDEAREALLDQMGQKARMEWMEAAKAFADGRAGFLDTQEAMSRYQNVTEFLRSVETET